jgi:hypothetical protein
MTSYQARPYSGEADARSAVRLYKSVGFQTFETWIMLHTLL